MRKLRTPGSDRGVGRRLPIPTGPAQGTIEGSRSGVCLVMGYSALATGIGNHERQVGRAADWQLVTQIRALLYGPDTITSKGVRDQGRPWAAVRGWAALHRAGRARLSAPAAAPLGHLHIVGRGNHVPVTILAWAKSLVDGWPVWPVRLTKGAVTRLFPLASPPVGRQRT